MTDRQLLQKFLDDTSHDAFAELVGRHIDMVYSTARRLVRDPHLADDVTQAVFVLLARRGHRISSKTVIAGWLYQATRLSALTALRGDRRRKRHEFDAGIEANRMRETSDSESAAMWQTFEGDVDAALAKLADKDRDAIVVRFLKNKSFAETGELLGISEDAAKMRVQRALQRLRVILAHRGKAVPAASLAAAMGSSAVILTPPVYLLKSTIGSALASSAQATGLSFTIAKGADTMMTWLKIKFALTATLAITALGTTAVVVGQQVHRRRSEVVAVVLPVNSTAAVAQPIAAPAPDTIPALAAAQPVTLHIKNVTPPQAIAALAKASGVLLKAWPESAWDPKYRAWSNPVPKVTLDEDAQPFFIVLQHLCIAMKARPNYNMGNDDQTITVMDNNGNAPSGEPTFSVPGYSVVVNSITRQYGVSFAQSQQLQESKDLFMNAAIDPRVDVLKSSRSVWVETATDENGVSIAVPHDNSSDQFYDTGMNGHAINSLTIPLNYDWTKSKRLKILKGHIRIMVGSKIQLLEIPDLLHAQGQQKTAAGVQLVVDEVTSDVGRLDVKVSGHRTGRISDARWKEINQQTMGDRVSIIDANGEKVVRLGGGGGSGDVIDLGTSYMSSNDLARPLKLSWPIATASETVDLPFEFKDLPLP